MDHFHPTHQLPLLLSCSSSMKSSSASPGFTTMWLSIRTTPSALTPRTLHGAETGLLCKRPLRLTLIGDVFTCLYHGITVGEFTKHCLQGKGLVCNSCLPRSLLALDRHVNTSRCCLLDRCCIHGPQALDRLLHMHFTSRNDRQGNGFRRREAS
jgi:hypothetical protein